MSMFVVVSHIFSFCVLVAHLVIIHLSGLGTRREWPPGWGSSSRLLDVVKVVCFSLFLQVQARLVKHTLVALVIFGSTVLA